jgi:hypothetical protein
MGGSDDFKIPRVRSWKRLFRQEFDQELCWSGCESQSDSQRAAHLRKETVTRAGRVTAILVDLEYYAPIWMRRGIAFGCFGIVTVNTPSFPVALTLSLSTVSGSTKRR